MAQHENQPSPPCGHLRYALLPTASTMARKSPSHSPKSSPSHESLAVGQAGEIVGREAPHWMDRGLADRLPPSAQTSWVGQFFARISRHLRNRPKPPCADIEDL